MSTLRLIRKAFLLATRSKRRFITFTVFYASLIALTAFFVNLAFKDWLAHIYFGPNTIFMIIVLGVSTFMSVLYALIIVSNRKTEIATLKCIGWKNGHIWILVSGEIMAVTLIAFIIVVEVFFHITSIAAYILAISRPTSQVQAIVVVQFVPIVITFLFMLGVQIAGILIANRKILKVRPIQALQKIA
nr:FtsX-like permease family protein [Candidatus Sigynarchaeota archaeon]